MALKKVIEIDVDVLNAQGGIASLGKTFEDVEKNTKSLKAQLREAITEVQQMNEKFGETSKEAINAAKRAAELKDKIEDANDAVQAFKGEGTFLATSKALSSVASGFGAVQGAMGLIGVESKDVQEQLLKVQSAMAVADGLAGLEDAGRSFKQLATVAKSYTIVQKAVTAAQWLWNAAMSANPIGAIVVVVTALIAAGYALVKMFMDSSEATKKAEKANIELNKSLDNQVKAQNKANQETELSSEHQLKMAKASGKSANEIRKLSVELANQEVAQKYANAQTLRAIAIEALRVAGLEDATEAQKETAKKALEAFNKANDDLKTSILNRRKLILDNRVAERQEQTDADKKAEENKKEANKKAKENQKEADKKAKEELQKQKDSLKSIEEKSKKDIEDLKAKTEVEKLELQKKRDLQELENVKLSAIKKAEALALIEQKYKILNDELKLKQDKEQKEKDAKEEEEEGAKIKADFEKRADEYDAKLKKEIQAEKDAAEAKRNINATAIDSARGLVSIIAGLGEKNKKLQKAALIANGALSIAEIINNTNVGSAKEVATKGVLGLSTSTILYAKMAISIGSVIAATAKGLSALGGGAAPSGGSTGGAGGGGGATSQAPQFNVVGNAGVNQIATTLGKEQPPVQAFVVSKQMTNQQEMDRNIVKNATL
jgi:DNA repair exonuclease SbcCD ATPase subunit